MEDVETTKIKLKELGDKLTEFNKKRPLNFFDITLTSEREISHSAFLAWLLNPKENHGLNDLFLQKILKIVDFNEKYDFKKVVVETEITRKRRRIDIIIHINNITICIENKIWDYPTSKQIEEEIREFKPNYMILLAPKVTIKSFKEEAKEISGLQFMDYDQIQTIINKIKNKASENVRFILEQYNKNLEVNIMTNKLLNFNEKSMLYVERYNEVDKVIKEFKEERKNIWKAFLERLKQKHPDFRHRKFDGGDYIIIYKDSWEEKFDIFISIELSPREVKNNQTIFSLHINKNDHPKIKQVRDYFEKICYSSFSELDYRFVDETYCLYKKTIVVDHNFVDAFYDEINKLLNIRIVKLIDDGISSS